MADGIDHSGGLPVLLVRGSRRTFLRRLSAVLGGLSGSWLLIACTSSQVPPSVVTPAAVGATAPPAAAPTVPPAPGTPTGAATQVPGAAAALANRPTQAQYWLSASGSTPKRGGIFSMASVFAPDTLDVHIAQGVAGWSKLLYEPLIRIFLLDPATGEHALMPALATSWAQPDPTTIVLNLRHGVKFHDGSDFNASVAKWNLDRIRADARSQARQGLTSIQSVDAADDYTLNVHLSSPNTAQLSLLGANPMIQMLSQAHFEAVGEAAFGKDPSGTGPMRLKAWIPDQKLDLEPFNGYWATGADGKALPYLDGFTFRVIPDDSVALTDMQSGTLDLYESGIQAQNIPIARADPSMTYFEFGWTGTIRPTIGFNQRKGPFADLRLRQAALYALDRQAQADAFGKEVARVHNFPYWYPYFLGWDDSLPHYTYDPEKAKQLVAQVNPAGVDVQLSQIAREPDNSMSVVLKSMWDKVGLNTTITAMERLAWIDRQRKDDFQVAFWGHALPALDPDALSAVFVKGSAINWNNWESPAMEDLLKRGREEADSAKRTAIYKQAQRTIYDDAAFGCSFLVPSNLTHRASVKAYGVEITAGYYNEVWLDR